MIEAKDEGLAVAKALFRYPHEQRFCKLEQIGGQPDVLMSCEELGVQRGFVMAPFAPSEDRPVIVIRPDRVDWGEVPQGSL